MDMYIYICIYIYIHIDVCICVYMCIFGLFREPKFLLDLRLRSRMRRLAARGAMVKTRKLGSQGVLVASTEADRRRRVSWLPFVVDVGSYTWRWRGAPQRVITILHIQPSMSVNLEQASIPLSRISCKGDSRRISVGLSAS